MSRSLTKLAPILLAVLPHATADADERPISDDAIVKATRPLEAAEAKRSFRLAAGFRLEQVAAEPLVRDPIAMEFDENGRAYVIELPPYNEYAKRDVKSCGAICLLEDTDGNGQFDKRTTFADDLTFPTGLFCYGGGLLVGDAPDLKFLRDTDGDGRADQREVLFTGFGREQAGEGQLNSFRWGLDNRVYLSTGRDGGEVRAADRPHSPARAVRNRTFVLDPKSRSFELTSGGGQYGMSFDDWGRIYVCDNSTPVVLLMYDDRYLARNPWMTAPPAAVSIAPDGKYTKLLRISPQEPWRMIRTNLRSQGKFAGPVEGGRPSGFFTAATGITVYRGSAMPGSHRGSIFVGEAANNLVYRAQVTLNGINRLSERADHDAEFLASTDTWFRPVQFANAPDGTLYVLDMYRELIEGAAFLPPHVLAEMDPTAGSNRGRIYRIVPADFRQPAAVRLGDMSTVALAGLLEHPNGWHRDTAARILYERQDPAALPTLRKMLSASTSPLGRMHALYALDGLQSLTAVDVLRGLNDEHAGVREHAVRLGEKFVGTSEEVLQKLVAMSSDPDILVRYQLAFSLGFLPARFRDPALVEVIRRDGNSPWMRLAVQSSLGDAAAGVFRRLLSDRSFHSVPCGREFLESLARQVGRAGANGELHAVVTSIDDTATKGEREKQLARSLLIAILNDSTAEKALDLAAASGGAIRQMVPQLLREARETALDGRQSEQSRVEAVAILGCGSFATEQAAFAELLEPWQPQPIQEAVLRVLPRFSDAAIAELILDKWPVFTPRLRAAAAELLFSRQGWTERLLEAVETRRVATGDIDPSRAALLQSHASAQIRERAANVFAHAGVAGRAQAVAEYQQALSIEGSVDAGHKIFQKSCSACHQLDGVGTAVGADLHAIADRGLEAILLNILDPNRDVKPQFLTYLVLTVDGRTVTGMITEETTNHLTIQQSDGTHVKLPRSEIDEISSSGISFMPEGLEREIDLAGMADLLAFLKSIK